MTVRSLVIVGALCLCSTSASAALTVEACKAKYKAELAERGNRGMTWAVYQERICGLPREPHRQPKSNQKP